MGDPRKDPTSETTSKDGEKRGRREEYPSFPMQKPFVKAFTMPRTGITYLYNISMSVNMNMKGTPLKSGVSPINLSNSDDIYLSNRMIDTLTQKPTKGTTCNGCGRTTHLGVPVPYHIRYLLNTLISHIGDIKHPSKLKFEVKWEGSVLENTHESYSELKTNECLHEYLESLGGKWRSLIPIEFTFEGEHYSEQQHADSDVIASSKIQKAGPKIKSKVNNNHKPYKRTRSGK